MLRASRGGDRLCEIVQNTLGSDVVEALHDRGFLLSGFVKTLSQVQIIEQLGDSKVFPIVQSEEAQILGKLGINGLFAVYRRLPDVRSNGLDPFAGEELSYGEISKEQVA